MLVNGLPQKGMLASKSEGYSEFVVLVGGVFGLCFFGAGGVVVCLVSLK